MTEREFARLWTKMRARLHRRALRLLWSEQLAEEAVGETLVSLCRVRERLPAQGQNGFDFAYYAYYLLRRRAIAIFHREKRAGRIVPFMVTKADGEEYENPELLAAALDAQSQARESSLQRQAVLSRMAERLTEREQDILAMHLDGFSFVQIGAAFRLTRQRVQQIVTRCQAKLCERRERRGSEPLSTWNAESLFALGTSASSYQCSSRARSSHS